MEIIVSIRFYFIIAVVSLSSSCIWTNSLCDCMPSVPLTFIFFYLHFHLTQSRHFFSVLLFLSFAFHRCCTCSCSCLWAFELVSWVVTSDQFGSGQMKGNDRLLTETKYFVSVNRTKYPTVGNAFKLIYEKVRSESVGLARAFAHRAVVDVLR